MPKGKLLLGTASSLTVSILSICIPFCTYAQVAIGSRSTNHIPLSQQALQEMNQGGSSVLSNSMQLLSIKKDVKFSPLENINAAWNWLSGKPPSKPTSQGISLEATDRTIADFKTAQKLKTSSSISYPSTSSQYTGFSINK